MSEFIDWGEEDRRHCVSCGYRLPAGAFTVDRSELGGRRRVCLDCTVREGRAMKQRAALALDLLPRLEAEARDRQREHGGTAPGQPAENTSSDFGRSDAKAAELVGVGRSTVALAKPIQRESRS